MKGRVTEELDCVAREAGTDLISIERRSNIEEQ